MHSPIEEAKLLREGLAVRTREDLVLIDVRGDDRRQWLNGQLTNDVRGVTADDSVYALAVTVRGKIMADAWVFERTERLGVVLPRAAAESVLASFERQIIMEDVSLEPTPARLVVVHGEHGAELLDASGVERHRHDELGRGDWLGIFENEAAFEQSWPALLRSVRERGGDLVGDAGFELARLRAARPRFGQDFWDQHYPQEAGLLTDAVSFNKGCYLGQEVICTLENRGRTSRRLVALAGTGALVLERGARLCDMDGNDMGELTSVCVDPEHGVTLALGYLKSAAAVVGNRVKSSAAHLEVRSRIGDA